MFFSSSKSCKSPDFSLECITWSLLNSVSLEESYNLYSREMSSEAKGETFKETAFSSEQGGKVTFLWQLREMIDPRLDTGMGKRKLAVKDAWIDKQLGELRKFDCELGIDNSKVSMLNFLILINYTGLCKGMS